MEAPICDALMFEPLLGVDHVQSYRENIKSPTLD